MINKIKKHSFFIKHKKYFRFLFFCFVGVSAFAIDWSFFNLFYKFGVTFVIANTMSWIISMIFNFSVNRNITFSARGYSLKNQIVKWLSVYGIAFLIRINLARLVLGFLGETSLNANIAFFSGILISIPIAFFGSLFWAFKKSDYLYFPEKELTFISKSSKKVFRKLLKFTLPEGFIHSTGSSFIL